MLRFERAAWHVAIVWSLAALLGACRHDVDAGVADADAAVDAADARDAASDSRPPIPDVAADADAGLDVDQDADATSDSQPAESGPRLDLIIDGDALGTALGYSRVGLKPPNAAAVCGASKLAVAGGVKCQTQLLRTELSGTSGWTSGCIGAIQLGTTVCIDNRFNLTVIPKTTTSAQTSVGCAGNNVLLGFGYKCSGGAVVAAYPSGNTVQVQCTTGSTSVSVNAICSSDPFLRSIVKSAKKTAVGPSEAKAICSSGVALGGGCSAAAVLGGSAPYRAPTGETGWICWGPSVVAYVICAEP